MRVFYSLLILLFIVSCNEEPPKTFESGALTNVKANQITGYWIINELFHEGKAYPVSERYSSCDRDYTNIKEDHTMTDRVFQDSNCSFIEKTYKWSLNNGILTLANEEGKTEWVILKVSNNSIRVRLKADFDKDGKLDVIEAILIKHKPKYIGKQELKLKVGLKDDKIHLNWEPFESEKHFSSYELYRSTSKEYYFGKQIGTFSDINKNSFVDTPKDLEQNYYYTLVVISDEGKKIKEAVSLYNPFEYINRNLSIKSIEKINDEQLKVTIEPFNSLLFSHYEIKLRKDYPFLPYKYKFNNMNQTEFIIDIPYFANPRIVVYAFFKEPYHYNSISSEKDFNYTRPELLPPNRNYDKFFYPFESMDKVIISSLGNWKLTAVDTKTRAAQNIFERKSTAYFKLLNAYSFEKDNHIEYVYDNVLYFLDINNYSIKKKIVLNEESEYRKAGDFYIAIKNASGGVYNRKFLVYKIIDGKMTLLDTKIYDSYFHSNPSFVIVGDNKINTMYGDGKIHELEIDKNGKLKETQIVNLEISDDFKDGYFNSKKSYYVDFKNKKIINYPDGSIKSNLNNIKYIIGYDEENELIYATNYLSNNDFNQDTNLKNGELLLYDINGNFVKSFQSKGFPIFANKVKGGIRILTNGFVNFDSFFESNLFFEYIQY